MRLLGSEQTAGRDRLGEGRCGRPVDQAGAMRRPATPLPGASPSRNSMRSRWPVGKSGAGPPVRSAASSPISGWCPTRSRCPVVDRAAASAARTSAGWDSGLSASISSGVTSGAAPPSVTRADSCARASGLVNARSGRQAICLSRAARRSRSARPRGERRRGASSPPVAGSAWPWRSRSSTSVTGGTMSGVPRPVKDGRGQATRVVAARLVARSTDAWRRRAPGAGADPVQGRPHGQGAASQPGFALPWVPDS